MMNDQLKKATVYFDTYEAREEAFRKRVCRLIPRKYAGPKLFWSDFGRITLNELLQFIRQPIAYITSNPRDCLAFGTPWQVLTAAAMHARPDERSEVDIPEIARAFGIMENLYQPIRTLSGGETVKVSLAKSFLVSGSSKRLTIASPFSWLSRENSVYFKNLFQHYQNRSIPVDLFALEGEDSDETVGNHEACPETGTGVAFDLNLEDVRILLGSSLNPIYSESTYASVENFQHKLFSPCLIMGDNGQGKSLVAKALAGAHSCRGAAVIGRQGKTGPPRLLFQDVITQTLLRSFDAIARSAVCQNRATPMVLYEKIRNAYRSCAKESSSGYIPGDPPAGGGFRSLLEVKSILVAMRLCGEPSAIIIDEPDWGLTRAAAVAFVSAIISVCHQLGVPVILISHKPWWFTLAESVVRVQRTTKEIKEDAKYSFTINLTAMPTQTGDTA